MKPKDRQSLYQSQVDQELAKRKQEDHGWEDLVDVSPYLDACIFLLLTCLVQSPYQPVPQPYPSRLFKFISPSRASSSSTSSFDSDDEDKDLRACRLRIGRGGRRLLDRRILHGRSATSAAAKPSVESHDNDDDDTRRRLEEQWRFDEDDDPTFGAEGPDEQDRKLIDDFAVE